MNHQSHLFDLPENIHYLNCAYMSPLSKSVIEAGIAGVRQKAQPYSIGVNDFFDKGLALRQSFAQLIHADAEQVFRIPSVSYAISTIAKNLPAKNGKSIVITGEQFPSNIYPWKRLAEESGMKLRAIKAPDTLEGRGEKWNAQILDAIDDETTIVAMPHCHWTDGTLFDLKAIREKSRKVGAALVVDGTQSVGALPFDVRSLDPDALICAGYKWLMGPYSLGLAYLHPKYNNGTPLEENWINRKNSEDFSGLVDYEEQYQPGAVRFEMGENSNFILVPMLLEALNQVLDWTPEGIQSYCETITGEGIATLLENDFWVENPANRGHHLFGIRPTRSINVQHLREVLERKNIFVSIRGTSIRVAPHVYNRKESFDLLVQTLLNETRN